MYILTYTCICIKYMHINIRVYVYIKNTHTDVHTYIPTQRERIGMLNRVLLITRSWMCVYPANKAITQLKECRTDRLLSGIMQAIVCGESIAGVKCPWFGLPGGRTRLWRPLSGRARCLLPLLPSQWPVWLAERAGILAELGHGLESSHVGMYPATPTAGWDSPGPSAHQSPGSRQWQRHQIGHGQGEVDPAKEVQLILMVMIMTLNNSLWNL